MQIERVLVVEKNQLPVVVSDDLSCFMFDFFDPDVFYALGKTNDAFDDVQLSNDSAEHQEELDGLNRTTKVSLSNRYRIEKFFV